MNERTNSSLWLQGTQIKEFVSHAGSSLTPKQTFLRRKKMSKCSYFFSVIAMWYKAKILGQCESICPHLDSSGNTGHILLFHRSCSIDHRNALSGITCCASFWGSLCTSRITYLSSSHYMNTVFSVPLQVMRWLHTLLYLESISLFSPSSWLCFLISTALSK